MSEVIGISESQPAKSGVPHRPESGASQGRRRTPLLLLLLMALALCLRLIALAQEQTITPDGFYYAALAQSILAGEPARELSGYWSPLYPCLMAACSFVTGDLELAGRLVSVLAGIVLILPAFFLIRDSFGQRTALIGACLIAIHPLLIYYSVLVLTESTYTLLFTTTVLVGWLALRQNRTRLFLLTGMLTGASYLVRPEAFWYIVPLSVFTLLGLKTAGAGKRKKHWLNLGALLLGFLVLSVPYIAHVHQVTGRWSLSGKAAGHLLGSPKYQHPITGAPQSGLSDQPRPSLVLSRLAQSAKRQFQLFNIVFPVPFVMLAGLGLFRHRWSKERALREGYLLTFLLAATLGYIVTVPNIRFVVPLLPLLMRWVAKGVEELVEWAEETARTILGWSSDARRTGAGLLIVIIFLTGSMIPLFLYLTRGDKFIDYRHQQQAGLWIRHHSPKAHPIIMALSPLSSFYAGGKYVYLPTTSYWDARTIATQKEVDFIVVSQRDAQETGIKVLTSPQQIPEELCLSQIFGGGSPYQVFVYQPKRMNVCPS